MSTHKRGFANASAGEAGVGWVCEQLPFVSRLAVDNPSCLLREPWVEHLRECAECREEAANHSRALAIFRSIEGERLAREFSALAWESVQAAIQRDESEAETRVRSRLWWGIPVAAAAGVLAVAGVLGWDAVMDEGPPAPARIVRVEPLEQRGMEQVMRWMLKTRELPTDPVPAMTAVEARVEPADAEHPLAGAPEAQEFAGNVSPAPQESAGAAQEPLPTVPVRVPTVVMRRQSFLPGAGRGRDVPPLFRLEHRLIPTQPVSYPAYN